jgi:uncharacterized protein (DUF608 family)
MQIDPPLGDEELTKEHIDKIIRMHKQGTMPYLIAWAFNISEERLNEIVNNYYKQHTL